MDHSGNTRNEMDKIIRRYVRYIIFAIGVFIIASILFSGCDNLLCYPVVKDGYIQFQCGGEF